MNPERLAELERWVTEFKEGQDHPATIRRIVRELIAEIRRLQHSKDEAIGSLSFHSTSGCTVCRETLEGWVGKPPPFQPDHDLITYIEKKQD